MKTRRIRAIQQWALDYGALFVRSGLCLLASEDLIHWERTGGVSHIGCVECPDMFELPVDGNQENTRWVFWGGSGNHVIGTFDGRTFTRESGPFSTHVGNEYAAQTFSDIPEQDGRRIQLANLYGDVLPGMFFKNHSPFPAFSP